MSYEHCNMDLLVDISIHFYWLYRPRCETARWMYILPLINPISFPWCTKYLHTFLIWLNLIIQHNFKSIHVMLTMRHNCMIKLPSWYFILDSQNPNKNERKNSKWRPYCHTISMYLYFFIICLHIYLLTFSTNYIEKGLKGKILI